MARIHIHVTGIVQGVGYRPFVWRVARAHDITGTVRNSADGVHVDAHGEQANLDALVLALSTQAPAAARVDTVHVDKLPDGSGTEPTSFEIIESDGTTDRLTLVSPDIATCPQCLAELNDPADRRFHYPFINCTCCGPRFTIIGDLPYDRAKTSMAAFDMCPACATEYADPADRRFHAQPDACFECGPHLTWRTSQDPGHVIYGDDRESSDHIIDLACAQLLEGKTVAIKGLGGYHLACDATNPRAVKLLRERKHRPTKPLAVMFARLEQIRSTCEVGAVERGLLTGPVRPIVLLRRREQTETQTCEIRIAEEVAGTLPELGVMLPYTPLQHLIMQMIGRPLVMTSGNHADEPIITDDQVAVARLMDVADAFVGNDRPILARYDDSVVRVVDGVAMTVRRARGIAPLPLALPGTRGEHVPDVLACGPEQKATFCISRGSQAFVSQHVGDLESADAFDAWREDLEQYRRVLGLGWDALACDMHPSYIASSWAREQSERDGLPLVEVQHHHAHIASVLAEARVSERVVGVALDGTGYGTDGTIWGGEILACDMADFTRVAHLSTFRLPGGAAAIKRPLRTGLGLLEACGMSDTTFAAGIVERLGIEGPVVSQMLSRDLNCPRTSSAGRLFDAVAALAGIVETAGYSGEPACLLEAAATRALPRLDDAQAHAYPLTMSDQPTPDGSLELCVRGLVSAMVRDLDEGVDAEMVALRFHEGFCDGISRAALACAETLGLRRVAFSGGVFMNRLVLEGVRSRIEQEGLEVLVGRSVPVNDGCISFGQAAVARARLACHG